MNYTAFVLLLLIASGFTGCSAYRGGPEEHYNSVTGAEAHPQPAASPSMRPGMNPQDPRDAQFTTQPDPTQFPPSSKP